MTVEDLRLAPEQQLQQQQEHHQQHHQQHLPVSQDQEDSQESPTSSLDPSDKQLRQQLQAADSCHQLLQLLSTDKKEEEQHQGDLWWPEQLMVG